MTTFTGTKFNDALFNSGLFNSALSDHMPGLAGNDAPTADAGDRSVELAEHESATRSHADRAMLLHGDFSSLVDTDGKAGTDTVVEVELAGRLKADSNEVAVEGLIGRDDDISPEPAGFESVTRSHADRALLLHGDFSSLVDTDGKASTDTVVEVELVGRLKADSNEVAVEGLTGRDDDISLEPTRFENVTRPHSDGVVLLHGDFSSLVDTDAAIAAATEELFGNYNFVRSEPTTSAPESVRSMVDGHGNDAKGVGFADGTSNTIAFATNSVVESVNVKYTLLSDGDDDPVAGAARLARADYGSDGGSLRGGDLLDVGDLLFGLAGDESVTADGGDGFVESAASAGVTRPHARGVVTNNSDPDTLATVIDDIYDGTSSTFVDGIDRNGNNALGTRAGGEVVGSDSYIINGTTGTVSDSGNDAKITDITDGTSNTALDASNKEAAYIFGRTDGSAASNVIEALAEKYTMFDGEADGLLVGGAGGAGSLGLLAGGAGGAGSDPPTDDARDNSIALVEHESATRPHADEVLVLHGDFSSLVDSDAAIAAATEELFGNYNFLRIEPTSSEVDSGVKSRFADEGLIGDTGDSLVATALLHGDFSSLAENDAGGNEAKIVGFVDGTSNTVAFAGNNVVENVNVKYTFSGAEDDPVAGANRLARADYGSAGTALRSGEALDVANLLIGFDASADDVQRTSVPDDGATTLKFDTDVVDVVTDNKDPELLVAAAVAGGGGNGVTILDGISGNANNALGTHSGGEVLGGDWLTNDTTGTVSHSSNDVKLTDITDGTSNTLIVGGTDGGATSNVVDSVGIKWSGPVLDAGHLSIRFDDDVVNTNLLETMADDDNALFKGSVVNINAGGWDPIDLSELLQTDEANGSTNATSGTVSDGGGDARSAGVSDGLSNTLMIGERSAASNVIASDPSSEVDNSFVASLDMDTRNVVGTELQTLIGADRHARVDALGMHYLQTDGAFLELGDLFVDFGADDRVSRDSRSYTFADGIEGDVSKDVASGPAGKESLNANIDNIDPFVGMVVLDVGDVLVGFDDGVDNSNDSQLTRTAGGSTALQADPDGQANGIIAILIGLYTDTQGPLDSASLALD